MDSRLEVASKKKKGFFKKLSRMLGKSQNLEKAAEKQSAAEMKTVSGSFEDSSEILSNTVWYAFCVKNQFCAAYKTNYVPTNDSRTRGC